MITASLKTHFVRLRRRTVKEKIDSLPQNPGVYLFKNNKGDIIYIGKAKNLKSRVKSYFLDTIEFGTKTYSLIQSIDDIDYIEALSELEAFILEAELIKKHRPKYNINLKDDKSYIYIVIRPEKVLVNAKEVNFPILLNLRKSDLKKSDLSFGPYPDTSAARYVIRALRKIIPYRDCSLNKFNKYKKLERPCLYGHIGLCSAPCLLNVSSDEYRKSILKIKKILSGSTVKLLKSLNSKMNEASKETKYEKAASYRDVLNKFKYIRQNFKAAESYIENPYLVEDIAINSMKDLKESIPILNKLPKRIECYDVSNISGKDAVSSMVVATNGRLDKKEYRKFKINIKNNPDDFEMIRETLHRRLNNSWTLPDLFVIDGGKGQVSAAKEVMILNEINIPVIGIAKRFETIIYFDNNEYGEVNLARDNDGLKLIQVLRDEAHRFARKYHHFLRLKTLVRMK